MKPIRTSVRSPWQNGVAERWVGSVRREVLDHVIPLNDQHLRRLGREYIAYYQEDRTHIGLEKRTPAGRPVEPRPTEPRQPRACLASAVFIIGTPGRQLRDRSRPRSDHGHGRMNAVTSSYRSQSISVLYNRTVTR